MGRREKLEARLEKRETWAESRDRDSAAGFAAAHRIADGIPMGQPILIGHHSEKHHRRDIARIDSGMRRGVESGKMADHHRSKAAGLADQLADSIFSDDPDAVEALEAKAAAIEAKCDAWVAENKAFRKGPAAYAALLGITEEQEAARRARIMANPPWDRRPYAAYAITNARANARRCRQRIEAIRRQTAQLAKAEEAPAGVLVEYRHSHYDPAGTGPRYVVVTFPDYPGRRTVDELKAAGFHWSRPSWHGQADKLPESLRPAGEAR